MMEAKKDFPINLYAREAKKTAVYACSDYPLLALSEEVGEVHGKIAKYCRKNSVPVVGAITDIRHPRTEVQHKLRSDVEKELGDVMWQWANLCLDCGFDPAEVLHTNINKLAGRAERGTLNGEGDNR